jgi:crossover junction endodeoxyribonuclease RusA
VRLTIHPREPLDAAKRLRTEGPLWHLNVRCIDIDNAIKVAIDALIGVLYVDDDQLVTLLVDRGMPVAGGALHVTASPIDASNMFIAAQAQPALALAFDDDDPLADVA